MNSHAQLVAVMSIGLAVGLLAADGQVAAQSTGNAVLPPPYEMSYGQFPYGPKSATVAEGYLNGTANVIRAEGAYNYYTASGAVSAAEALRQNIENRQAIVKAYFELRKMNREYRAAERHPGLQTATKAQVAQVERPRPLSPQELDAQSGRIRWPKLLAADTHAENREALDEYFAARAEKRGVSTREMTAFRSVVLAMVDDLKEQYRSAPPADYEAATQFLRSLAYEGQRPVREGPRLVAASR
jgi:hypothetical protein